MKKFVPPIFLFWIAVLSACTLSSNPTPGPFPIPNQTMTALFSTSLPTLVITTRPGQSTAVPFPTQPAAPTQPEPTAMPNPTELPTQVPPTQPAPTQPPPTAVPQPSATPDLSRRSGTSVTAAHVNTPPTIDGDWNDLPNKEYPAEIVVYGASTWKSRDDLAASFRIAWDNTNLYIAAKVRDDKYVQNASGENLFKGDSLEILLDTNVSDDFYSDALNSDDFQLGISGGRPDVNGTREAYQWLPANQAGTRSKVKVSATRSEADGITRIEASIPWSLFGVKPTPGMHFGFVFSASDNDAAGQSVQQKMVSNVKTRVLVDPTTLGDLTLGN